MRRQKEYWFPKLEADEGKTSNFVFETKFFLPTSSPTTAPEPLELQPRARSVKMMLSKMALVNDWS